MPAPLIPRDTPLGWGDKVQLKVELWFDIDVGDWMDDDGEITTIGDLQRLIRRYESDSVHNAALRGDLGDREIGDVDFYATVPDHEANRILGANTFTRPVRFENESEQAHRVNGDPYSWATNLVGLDGNTVTT